MSLLDMFRKKPAPAAPAAPAKPRTPWQERVAQAERTKHFAWQDDNELARTFVRQLLTEAAPAFGTAKVVDGAPTDVCSTLGIYISSFGGDAMQRSDRNIELHGVYDSRPLRIPVSIPGKRVWALQMTCPDEGTYFRVLRNPASVPTPRDPNDPWENSQPPNCVFVGKGMSLDPCGLGSSHSLPQWASASAQAHELVLREMERLDLQVFELSNSDASVYALGFRTLDALDDMHPYLRDCAGFLAEFVKLHTASASAGPSFVRQVAHDPVRCRYCASLFLFSADHDHCPNCGAPPT